MLDSALERRIRFWLIFCVSALTLVVDPWNFLDPINLPKLFILAVSAFAIFGNLAPSFRRAITRELRALTLSVAAFVVALVLTFLTSGAPFWSQVYGDFGRNTGLLAYTSLALLLLSTVLVSNRSFVSRLLLALIVTGMFNAVYGAFQWAGWDPIKWNNPYNPIVGTLGNPNFASAHLGIASIATLAFVLGKTEKLPVRIILAANLVLSLFVIYQSNSSQGLLIFGFGAVIVIYFRFVSLLRFASIKALYWISALAVIVLGIFGLLNRGPLSQYLYQVSVTYRGDYWRAGWKMTLNHPFLGVGLDSYGSWYRFYRSEAATLRRGPDVTANSAHNVFLDISSNGGFLLLLCYVSIFGFIVRSGLRILRRSSQFDPFGIALVASWFAYVIQSLISINQLGLAIWGWVLGGAIIGYDLYKDRPNPTINKTKSPLRREQVSATSVLTGTLGLALGIAVAIWPSAQDVSFRRALEGGNPEKIERAALRFPSHNYYLNYTSDVFLQNKLEEQALILSRKSIAENPRDFNAWNVLIKNPKITEVERNNAIVKMKALDPFNTNIGK